MKLDMSKSYDRLNYHFIIKMLEDFGFSSNWIRLILNMVRSMLFSILVNGALDSQPFASSKGL
jgi:hypothetical protein